VGRHDPDSRFDFTVDDPAQGVHQLALAVGVLGMFPGVRRAGCAHGHHGAGKQVGVLGHQRVEQIKTVVLHGRDRRLAGLRNSLAILCNAVQGSELYIEIHSH